LGNEFNSCRSGKVYNSYSATVGGYLMLFVIYVIYYSRHIPQVTPKKESPGLGFWLVVEPTQLKNRVKLEIFPK